MESASPFQSCPHCKNEILLANFMTHEAYCVRHHKAQPFSQSSHPPPPSSFPISSSNFFPSSSQQETSSLFVPPSFPSPSSFPPDVLPPPQFFASSILNPVNSNSFLYNPSFIQQDSNIPPHSLSQIDENYRCLDCQNIIPISSFAQHESECEQRKIFCPLCSCEFPLPLMETHHEQCIGLEENNHIHSPSLDNNPRSRNQQSRGIFSRIPMRFNSSEIMENLFDLGRAKGLTKEEIDRFPTTKWKEEEFYVGDQYLQEEMDGKKCVVCYCEFKNGEQVRSLACWHRFHIQCIDKWLENHSTCPICKENMKKILKKGETFDFKSRIN